MSKPDKYLAIFSAILLVLLAVVLIISAQGQAHAVSEPKNAITIHGADYQSVFQRTISGQQFQPTINARELQGE